MRWSPRTFTLLMSACAGLTTVSVSAEGPSVPPISGVEVVLANHYKNQMPALTEEFIQAGMSNVHFQFVKRGQPPQNIGLGRDVPADKAREAISSA